MKATWSEDEETRDLPVSDWTELRPIVEAIQRRGSGSLLQLWIEGQGAELGVGIGKPRAVFTYQSSLNPPYYVSLGDPDAQGIETFWYGGECTEYLARNLVSTDLIIPTIDAFLRAPSRPNTVEWEKL